MTPIYTQDGKIIINNNKISTDNKCCCNCPTCTGSTCCGGEYPRAIGECCEGEWRLPSENGVCCSGVWRTGQGKCCGEVWYTEPGDCCGDTWFPLPEGVSLPEWTPPPPGTNFSPYPGITWETELCPPGYVYAKFGLTGQCCGCVPETVYDLVQNDYVPFIDIAPHACCNCTDNYFIGYSNYYWGNDYTDECLGACCVDAQCTDTTQVHGNDSCSDKIDYNSNEAWDMIKVMFLGDLCCAPGVCETSECCEDGYRVQTVSFAVEGEPVEGASWHITLPKDSFPFYSSSCFETESPGRAYIPCEGNSTETIAQYLFDSIVRWHNFSQQLFTFGVSVVGNVITLTAPGAMDGFITYTPPRTQTVSFAVEGEPFEGGASWSITLLPENLLPIVVVSSGFSTEEVAQNLAAQMEGFPTTYIPPRDISVVGNVITLTIRDAMDGFITYTPPGENAVPIVSQPTLLDEENAPPIASPPALVSSVISKPLCRWFQGKIGLDMTGYNPRGNPFSLENGQLVKWYEEGTSNSFCPKKCRKDNTGEIQGVCCQSVKSSGYLITLNKPVGMSGSVQVTVTGTTNSPILIHGTLHGAGATPEKRCSFTHTFVLCDGRFNIEPVPCGSSFHNLEAEVCYKKLTVTTESFNFSGCNDISLTLGGCLHNCTTTMNYVGPGHTSNATITITGNAVIAANGTGPLVLTKSLIHGCSPKTITFTGTNTQKNELAACRNPQGGQNPNFLTLRKEGPGTWWLPGRMCGAAQPAFAETAYVLDGTLVIQHGDFLFNLFNNPSIIVGQQGSSGEVRLFVSLDPRLPCTDETFSYGFTPSPDCNQVGVVPDRYWPNVRLESKIVVSPGLTQRVLLGAHPEGSPDPNRPPPGFLRGIELAGDVTLVAPTNNTVEFAGTWTTAQQTPATKNIRIGYPDFLGTIMLGGVHQTTGVVSIEYGKVLLKQGPGNPQFQFATSLLNIDSNCELIIGQSRLLSSPIKFTGNGAIISGAGTLAIASIDVSGNSNQISSIVTINNPATITGGGNILISGVVSGTSTLTMNGSGTITLSGNNSFNGTTIINSGIMKANSLSAFGTGQIVINAGGTLDKNGFSLTNTITNNGGTIIN